jgi:hypothetical protein
MMFIQIRIGSPPRVGQMKGDGSNVAEIPVLTYADTGLQSANAIATTRAGAARRLAGGLILASIAICGIAFFAVELWAARRGDFYGRFQAGTNRSLIDVVERLRKEQPKPGDIAINRCDINYSRQRIGNTWLRAANVLLDLPIRNPPDELCRPPDGAVAEWMRNERIRYLLHREPSLTMWHFQMTPRAGQTSPTGEPWTGQWRLYELTPGGLQQIAVERNQASPRRLTIQRTSAQ